MIHQRQNPFARFLDLSFLIGMTVTLAFYAMLQHPIFHGSLLVKYTAEHPSEYAIISLLFWGLSDIFLKAIKFPREFSALKENWLPEHEGPEPIQQAHALLQIVQSKPISLQRTRIGQRLTHALEHLVAKGSADDFREHLLHLEQVDDDTTHGNYRLIRFIVGISPVLGFLGTVVHFGTALSGISFDEMMDKLPLVVGEMGEAFNTTTAALTATMLMMFSLFVCERTELRIVRSVDRNVERDLLNRFEVKDSNLVPFLGLIKSANDESQKAIVATLDRQTEIWTAALDSVLERFDQRQQQESRAWNEALKELAARHETYDAEREARLRQLMTLIDSRQDAFMAHIQKTLEGAVSIRDDFSELVQALKTVARGEGQLLELQAALDRNLRVLHETQKFDEALHELTAAIHLLTARNRALPGNSAAA
jgi:biopolymer transport protein ExbB/TolQ